MLTPFPAAIGLSSSRLNAGMMLSTVVFGCTIGDRLTPIGMLCPDATEPFLASLVSLGLAGWAAIGPLIEPLTPDLILATAAGSSAVPAVLFPVCVRLTGDQDLLFPYARLSCEE